MQAAENLANKEEFAPIVEYGNSVLSHLNLIRGRTVIPPSSRSAVLGAHEANRVASSVQRNTQDGVPNITYIFHRSPASSAELSKKGELKPILLSELKWCERMTGRVLVVRAIAPPCVVEGALCAVIEDTNGSVHILRIYNTFYPGCAYGEREIIPVWGNAGGGGGVALAIKEPYCEAATEATSGVRVDHPSDLLYLSQGDDLYPNAWKTFFPKGSVPSEKLKDEGNDCFKSKSYRAAICKYTSSLKRNPTDSLKTSVLLNRSQAYLQLEEFSNATADAEEIITLSGDQPNEKALYRASRAHYALGQYDRALELLQKLMAAFPQNRDAKSLLSKTKWRLDENKLGKYDWSQLIEEARKSAPRAEVANYLGQVALSEDGTVVAKEDIKAGELLLCEKATEILYPSEIQDENRELVFDVTRGILGQGEGWRLTQKIASKIRSGTTSGDDLFGLAKNLKIFGEELHSGKVIVSDKQTVADIHVLDSIREAYAIPFPTLHPAAPSNSPPAQGLGLWIIGSRVHVGHSCLPNACRSFFGDILVLRACRDIKRGEPISITYIHPSLPLNERRTELARPPGVPCTCKFCEIEEEEGTELRQRRVDLVEKVKEISQRAPAEMLRTDAGRDESNSPDDAVVREVAKEVATLCDELDATYTQPSVDQPRFPLLEPLAYLFACYLYLGPSSTEDALRVNARYLSALGFSFQYVSDTGEKGEGGDMILIQHGYYHPFIIKTLVQQASVCWQLGKKRTATAWKRIAENSMEIITGHRKLFRDGYQKVFESLKWEI